MRPLRFEGLLTFDEAGKAVYSVDEEAAAVYVQEEDWALLKGRVVTPNHPRGWGFAADDPRRAGSSFIRADLELAARAEVQVMRAVSARYRHSVKPSGEGWSAESFERTIRPAYDRIESEVQEEFVGLVRSSRMRGATAEAVFYHEIMERLSREP